MYYHARYYDPSLGKFLTPDSIVPGASIGVGGALGTVGQEQNSILTVDFHEAGFATSLQGENQQILSKGFWFQLSGQDKQQAKDPWGPNNPQALNRFSYALDNPLGYNDPTGHGGVVVNPSHHPIYVTGDVPDPTAPTGKRTVTYRVDPGYSSEDYGMTDADFFDTGYGNSVVKIGDLATATIIDHPSDPSGLAFTVSAKGGLFGRLAMFFADGLINGYGPVDRDKAYRDRYGNDYANGDPRSQATRVREHADQTTPAPVGAPRPIPCANCV